MIESRKNSSTHILSNVQTLLINLPGRFVNNVCTLPILSCPLITAACPLFTAAFCFSKTWQCRDHREEEEKKEIYFEVSVSSYGVYPVRPHLQYSFLILFSMHSKNNDPFRSTFGSTFGFLRSWKQRLFNISIFLKPFLLHFTSLT